MSAGASTRVSDGRRYAVLTLCVACLVGASVIPTSGGAAATGPLGVVGVDKWLHLAGYAGLGTVTAAALRARTRRSLVVAAAFAVGVGVGVEVVQGVLPYRSLSAADVLANAAGVALGVACWRVALAPDGGDASDG